MGRGSLGVTLVVLTWQVVPLKKGGEGVAITEANKLEYLALLAEHQLVMSVKKEVKAFLEGIRVVRWACIMYYNVSQGFHKLVPGELLAIFDEKELEVSIERWSLLPAGS